MADYNDLIQSYIAAHPGATEADAQKGLLALMPGNDSQIANLNTPVANNTPSSYDVQTSDTTVPMKGNQPTMDAPVTPPEQPPIELSKEMPSTPGTPPTPVVSAAQASVTKQPDTKNPVSDVSKMIDSNNFSADNAKREAMLAENEKTKKLSALPIALAGAGDAISNASAPFGGKPGEEQMGKVSEMLHTQEADRKKEFEDKLKNDPQSDISKSYRAMVLKIAPDLSGNSNFENMSAMAIGDKLPLIDTMIKASSAKDMKELGLKQIAAQKELTLSEKNDQFANRAVNQAITRLSSVRGDPSVARAETQRDAAATVVNRINDVQKSGQGLNPFDYADMLGQLYKARTGASPGEQIMKDIRQPVASAQFNKAWTYLSGKQAPGTSADITASLKDAADSMGKQADQFHEGYMKPHIIKPAGVTDEQWQPIAAIGRGNSYADSIKLHDQATGNKSTSSEPTKTLNGKTYVSHNGQWYEAQ